MKDKLINLRNNQPTIEIKKAKQEKNHELAQEEIIETLKVSLAEFILVRNVLKMNRSCIRRL